MTSEPPGPAGDAPQHGETTAVAAVQKELDSGFFTAVIRLMDIMTQHQTGRTRF